MKRALRRSARGLWVALGVACVAAALPFLQGSAVAAVTATTQHIDVSTGGTTANQAPSIVDVSDDGRYVVWQSWASNLVPGSSGAKGQIFWRDRVAGVTKEVSVSSSEVEGNDTSEDPKVSEDGRFVAFVSGAANLVGSDTNSEDDVFVRDVVNGTTERVSVSSSEAQADAGCFAPVSISDDGRYVAFATEASGFGAVQTPQQCQVYVRDRQDGTTHLVSVDASGDPGTGDSYALDITPDGNDVLFLSTATNINDDGDYSDIWVRDRAAETNSRANIAPAGQWMECGRASISNDGRFVAFHGTIDGINDPFFRVWVRDLEASSTVLVSKSDDGTSANDMAFASEISGDGLYVVYHSDATNLVANDTNGRRDIFRYDRTDGITERMSLTSSGEQSDYTSYGSAVSADGQVVAFIGSELVPGSGSGQHLFARVCGDPPALIATQLSFYAPKVSAYRSARVYGWLKDGSGATLPGRPVEIQYYSGGWKKVATVTTDANGRYLKTMKPSARTSYRALFAGDATYESKTSAGCAVTPKVRLTRTTSWRTLRRNRTYTAKGYIAPRHYSSNRKVTVRVYKKGKGGKYYYKKSSVSAYRYHSSSKTHYTGKVRFTSKGKYKLVARHYKDSKNYTTYGSPDYVTVK